MIHGLHVAPERVDWIIGLQNVSSSLEFSRLESCDSSFCTLRFIVSQVLLPFEWLPSGVAFMFAASPTKMDDGFGGFLFFFPSPPADLLLLSQRRLAAPTRLSGVSPPVPHSIK